jgi:hypothetical protein
MRLKFAVFHPIVKDGGRMVSIVITESAHKHGVSDYAINTCLQNFQRDIILEDDPEKRLFVGFDHNGNALEVIAIIQGDVLTVIHAMKLRKQYFGLLPGSL